MKFRELRRMLERMSRTIYVTSLFEMPRWVRELKPSHLVSVIQPELQPARPSEIDVARHLRIGVDDISEPLPDALLPGEKDVASLIEFLGGWQPHAGSVLIHCFAGISRSTACALIAHVMQTRDPERSTSALASASPHARPNRRIVALADQILGFDGALSRARESMVDGIPAVEAPLSIIRL
jgi:predicted protein tyrosine phosphatase